MLYVMKLQILTHEAVLPVILDHIVNGVITYLRRLSPYSSQACSACCAYFNGHCKLLDTIFCVDNANRLDFTSARHPARHYFDRDSRARAYISAA